TPVGQAKLTNLPQSVMDQALVVLEVAKATSLSYQATGSDASSGRFEAAGTLVRQQLSGQIALGEQSAESRKYTISWTDTPLAVAFKTAKLKDLLPRRDVTNALYRVEVKSLQFTGAARDGHRANEHLRRFNAIISQVSIGTDAGVFQDQVGTLVRRIQTL